VSDKKSSIIITDGTESSALVADSIKAALTDFDAKSLSAENFAGTDILPCELFFIGAEEPSPPSFAYLKEMLAHINFASRKCGIFSTNKQALAYIQEILKDCEASCPKPLLVSDAKNSASDVKKWVSEIAG
jgi:hypothetical protein